MLKSLQTCAVASLLVAGVLAAGTAIAQDASSAGATGPHPVGIRFTAQESRAADRALTSKVLQSAKPMKMPELSEDEFRQIFPGGGAPITATEQQPLAPEAAGNVNSYPLRWAGKLFLAVPSVGSFGCTAQFIDKNILLTAGHCVSYNGKFLNSLTFRRQYKSGAYNPTSYPIGCVGAWPGWIAGGTDKYRWDYAMIKVNANSADGHMGSMINWINSYKTWQAIGYPAAISGGEIIQRVGGQRGTVGGGVAEFIHNVAAFTQGASGGAWILKYNAAVLQNNNYAGSVNSFIRTNLPGRVYGPHFDSNFVTLLNYVRNGCR